VIVSSEQPDRSASVATLKMLARSLIARGFWVGAVVRSNGLAPGLLASPASRPPLHLPPAPRATMPVLGKRLGETGLRGDLVRPLLRDVKELGDLDESDRAWLRHRPGESGSKTGSKPDRLRLRKPNPQVDRWGGQDLNLRPTDYEFDSGASATCAANPGRASEQRFLSEMVRSSSGRFPVRRGADTGHIVAHSDDKGIVLFLMNAQVIASSPCSPHRSARGAMRQGVNVA
jgi:hypothetical protein